jgi:hypothetical protein
MFFSLSGESLLSWKTAVMVYSHHDPFSISRIDRAISPSKEPLPATSVP